jgi:hypothetical protein
VACSHDKTSATYKGLSKAYSILFSVVFVSGISSYFAYTYELFWARHCGLTHPFQRRYWRLLLGMLHHTLQLLLYDMLTCYDGWERIGEEELTQLEQDFYKTRKVANHSSRPAKHTAPQGEPMINNASSPLDGESKTPKGSCNGSTGFKQPFSHTRATPSGNSTTGGSNSGGGVEVKRGGYDLDEEDDGNDTTRGSSAASSRQPLHGNGERSDRHGSGVGSAVGVRHGGQQQHGDDDEEDANLSRHEAALDPLDSPMPRAGSRQSMPPVSFEPIPMTRSASRGSSTSISVGGGHHHHHSINHGSDASTARGSQSYHQHVISSMSPTLSPSTSLHRSSSANNTSSSVSGNDSGSINSNNGSGNGNDRSSSVSPALATPPLQTVVVVPVAGVSAAVTTTSMASTLADGSSSIDIITNPTNNNGGNNDDDDHSAV